MKLIEKVMGCMRRYDSRREADKREADYFWSDPFWSYSIDESDLEREQALRSTRSAAFEIELCQRRALDREAREAREAQRQRDRTLDDLPVLGVMYDKILSVHGAANQRVGFLLINKGTVYEVKFEGVLEPLRRIPESFSYDGIMSRIPERNKYYFEGRAINHLRYVLHIHDLEDPLLDTSFRNLDAPVEIFHPLSNKASRYQPLSDQDSGFIVGFLNSTFRQMKKGRWF